MVNNKLKSIAEDYFSNLNPIAARIHSDIKEVQLSYENLWDTLNEHDQNEIIDESIIKPEISLQYALLTPTESQINFEEGLSGFNNLITGQKIVHDENYAYRDEYSAPFSMKTNSQLNLSIFGIEKVVKPQVKYLPGAKSDPKEDLKSSNINESDVIPKIIKPPNEANFLSELKSRTQMKNEESVTDYSRTDDVMDNDIQLNFDTVDNIDTIKTGYDFLDNW